LVLVRLRPLLALLEVLPALSVLPRRPACCWAAAVAARAAATETGFTGLGGVCDDGGKCGSDPWPAFRWASLLLSPSPPPPLLQLLLLLLLRLLLAASGATAASAVLGTWTPAHVVGEADKGCCGARAAAVTGGGTAVESA